jgi:hypothetical protein
MQTASAAGIVSSRVCAMQETLLRRLKMREPSLTVCSFLERLSIPELLK